MNASAPVLVTGATGFIGAHLARALRIQGSEVRALVREGRDGSSLEADGIRVVRGDLTDARSLHSAVDGCDTVFHLAAATSRTAAHSVDAYTRTNSDGTLALLHACNSTAVRHAVICSSSGVYGRLASIPAHEEVALRPDTLYRRSKLAAERVTWPFLQGQQTTVAIARPSAVYGEGSENWLPLFRNVQTGRLRMLGDGMHPYHVTHVDDVVTGLLCCRRREAAGRIYNIAAATCPTLRDLFITIADVLGVPFAPTVLPTWPFHRPARTFSAALRLVGHEPSIAGRVALFTEHRAYDIDRARREIGYAPSVTLREGVERTVAWYRATGGLA